jgi:hypothetical protein
MNRAIRALAAVALALMLFALFLNLPLADDQTPPSPNLVATVLARVALITGYLAGFVTGIVALVATALGHRWRWFLFLLPIVVLCAYSPYFGEALFFVLFPEFDRFSVASPTGFAFLQLGLSLGFPALTALVTLVYAIRNRIRVSVPDVEVSSIEEPDPVV